eukprot:IDg21901t1
MPEIWSGLHPGQLMTKFQRGLLPSLRPLLRQVRRDFTGPNALAEFAEHAAAIHASQKATGARPPPNRVSKALAIEMDPRSKRESAATLAARDDVVALADFGQGIRPLRVRQQQVSSTRLMKLPQYLSARTRRPGADRTRSSYECRRDWPAVSFKGRNRAHRAIPIRISRTMCHTSRMYALNASSLGTGSPTAHISAAAPLSEMHPIASNSTPLVPETARGQGRNTSAGTQLSEPPPIQQGRQPCPTRVLVENSPPLEPIKAKTVTPHVDLKKYDQGTPFWLPPTVTVDEYRRDPVCHLSFFNYKLEALICPTKDTQRQHLTVLDTGAGPNLIRAALLPEDTLNKLDQSRETVNLSSASKHRLDVMGLVSLTVTVADLSIRQTFVVVRQLGADVILGCQFIDSAVDFLSVRGRHLILTTGKEVPIARRRAVIPTDRDTSEVKTIRPRNATPRNLIRCAQRVVLPPRSETNVLVSCALGGTRMLESFPNLYGNKMVAIANGVAQVRPHVPFVVRVANLSNATVTIPKNQKLGTAIEAPISRVLAISFEGEDHSDGTAEIATSSTDTPIRGSNIPTDKPPCLTVDQIDLSCLSEDQRREVRRMLERFSDMWQGHLGEVTATQHRIDLLPGARPQYSQPYRAGPESRKVIESHINDMKSKGVIESAQSQWAAPIVLAPKADGTLRFCIDYRRLNALTVKDTYPLPRMDDCLDSLGTASHFTTLDCNSGYWKVKLAEGDRDKTAFTSHAGTFQFKRMSFGLCNAPETFQRALDILLAGYRWRSCFVYLDDVIIFSSSFEDHLKNVAQVLTVLQSAGLSLKLAKCKFFLAHSGLSRPCNQAREARDCDEKHGRNQRVQIPEDTDAVEVLPWHVQCIPTVRPEIRTSGLTVEPVTKERSTRSVSTSQSGTGAGIRNAQEGTRRTADS